MTVFLFGNLLHCDLTPLLHFSKRSRLLRSVKNVNAGISSVWQNSCSEQLPDLRCRIQMEVFCQTETFRPVLKLHCTVFHYVENSLHPDSSPAYQSSPLNLRRLPNASSVWSPFICTWHHLSLRFCSVSVNRAQPLPLTMFDPVSPEPASVTVTIEAAWETKAHI